jgi:hypothetical protein
VAAGRWRPGGCGGSQGGGDLRRRRAGRGGGDRGADVEAEALEGRVMAGRHQGAAAAGMCGTGREWRRAHVAWFGI